MLVTAGYGTCCIGLGAIPLEPGLWFCRGGPGSSRHGSSEPIPADGVAVSGRPSVATMPVSGQEDAEDALQ
jgi:hypothetical protein